MIYIAIIVLVIIVSIIGWYISVSNQLNRLVVKVDEAESGIDVALTKRYDVLVKMMDTVKAYTKHEKETLFEVIKLRSGMTMAEKNKASHMMDENMNKINALMEAYPELKSSENYLELQKSILDVEEHLQAARRLYNMDVTTYNTAIQVFPTNLIASAFHFTEEKLFELEPGKANNIDIKF